MSQSAQWNVIIRVLNVAQLMSNIFFSNKKSNFAVSGCRERFARTARLACRVSTLGGGRKESSNIGAQYCAFDSQGYDAAAALQRRREPSLLCTVEAVEAGYLWLFMVISSCCLNTHRLVKMDWLIWWADLCALFCYTLPTEHIPLFLNSWHATSPWQALIIIYFWNLHQHVMLQFFGPARTKLIYNYIDRTAGTEQWGQQIARPAVLQPRRPGQEQGNMEWLWFDVRNIESYIESYQFYISYPVDIYSASQCRRIDSDWYRSWVIWSQPLASCLPLLSAAGHAAGFWSSKPNCSGFWARFRPSESLERGRRGTVLPLTCPRVKHPMQAIERSVATLVILLKAFWSVSLTLHLNHLLLAGEDLFDDKVGFAAGSSCCW